MFAHVIFDKVPFQPLNNCLPTAKPPGVATAVAPPPPKCGVENDMSSSRHLVSFFTVFAKTHCQRTLAVDLAKNA